MTRDEAESDVGEVARAVMRWRDVAMSTEIGLTLAELNEFEPAFEQS